MTYDQLKERFPNASEQCLLANASDHGTPSGAQPERALFDAALGSPQGETSHPGRVRIRITSYRRRLLDPDNLAGGCKYFVDCCRYSGLVRGDSPADIEFAAAQEKVGSKEDERTEIVIERVA